MSKLNPAAKKVWLDYGQALEQYPLRLKALARELGVTEWTVRQACAYTEEFGPPTDDDQPGALHLVIGDVHLKPGTSHDRMRIAGLEMEELGREAMANSQAFRVVFIGDTADMESLSHYDRGKLSGEGRRLQDDLAALGAGLSLFRTAVSDEVWAYANTYWVEGNHEYRIQKYVNDHPELEGTLDLGEQFFRPIGITPVPFLEWLQLDGQGYCHYMQSRAGRAIGGVNHARALLLKGHKSVTVGHSHILSQAMENDIYGNVIQTLVCGCYFDHDEEYAMQSNAAWWRGLCIKRNTKSGSYDLETRTLAALKRKHKEA